jgi:hypothetical protein
MNKELFLLPILILLITSNTFALPAKLDWNKLPIEKDIKQYENKKYDTPGEYIKALQEGKCSSVWVYMNMDRESKISLIDSFKQMYKEKEGVIINQSAEYYVDEIDAVIADDQDAKNYKLKIIFTTIAVMDYDFDEGMDKEETYMKWLEPAYFEIIKASMGVKSK